MTASNTKAPANAPRTRCAARFAKKLLAASLLAVTACVGIGSAALPTAHAAAKEVTADRGQGLLGDMPIVQTIAKSPYQWTGITVSPQGRIFVCYPQSANHPGIYSVGEIIADAAQPVYTDFIFGSAESLVSDRQGNLWVLDASTSFDRPCDPAKTQVVVLEPDTGVVRRTYALAGALAADSHLEDLCLDEKTQTVYLTDSGHGGILVLDLATGDVWRALTDIREVRANLQSIYFPHSGLYNDMKHSAAIALDKGGTTLYFSARGGDILYSVPTAVLRDRTMAVADRAKKIRTENMRHNPADGMTCREDMIICGNLADEGVYAFLPGTENPAQAGGLLELNMDFRWADGFATAPDTTVYFTTSAKNYPAEKQAPYMLYRLIFPKAVAETNS